MAHSDALIFLTNISWTFFLFFFLYFFFVLYFLPTFYKKVRARTLVRRKYHTKVALLAAKLVSSLLLFRELSLVSVR